MIDQPALDVSGATVAFGARVALDAVDLQVADAEGIAVVGPSGCGKSTLLRAIAGLHPLIAGTIRRDGRDLAAVPPHKRGIGMMFQQHALFPHRDVASNVGFGLERSGVPADARRRTVARMLEMVGLAGFGARSVGDLSGGEQQRVALARALAPAPAVLLLDEPMGALDASLRHRLVRDLGLLIGELRLTVVAVTHDREEAFALADRIVVMDDGRVRQVGTPLELWRAPSDRRVVDLRRIGTAVSGTRTGGVVRGAWGSGVVPGPDGDVTLLVRPDAVVLDPAGEGRATVATAAFQGTSVELELVLDDGSTVRAQVPVHGAPERGAAVAFRIERVGLRELTG